MAPATVPRPRASLLDLVANHGADQAAEDHRTGRRTVAPIVAALFRHVAGIGVALARTGDDDSHLAQVRLRIQYFGVVVTVAMAGRSSRDRPASLEQQHCSQAQGGITLLNISDSSVPQS